MGIIIETIMSLIGAGILLSVLVYGIVGISEARSRRIEYCEEEEL